MLLIIISIVISFTILFIGHQLKKRDEKNCLLMLMYYLRLYYHKEGITDIKKLELKEREDVFYFKGYSKAFNVSDSKIKYFIAILENTDTKTFINHLRTEIDEFKKERDARS